MKDAGTIDRHTKSVLYATVVTLMVFAASCFVMTEMTEAMDPTVATFTWNESELAAGTTTELVITTTVTGVMPSYVADDAASGTNAPWKNYRNVITAVSMVDDGGSITSITQYAFYNIPGMTQMDISQSIEEVDAGSFEGCTALERFSVSAANAKLLDDNGVLYEQSAFMPTKLVAFPSAYKSGTDYASSYTMVQEATGIAAKAFKGATYLASVQLSSSLTSIGDEAFYGCTGITSIYLPKTVASIGEDAFFGMTSLETLDVDPKNQTYTVMNGCLFTDWTDENEVTYDNGELLFSPMNNQGYESSHNNFHRHIWNETGADLDIPLMMPIPFCVRCIHDRAFYNSVISDVYISDNVKRIGDQAFEGCASLTSVYIPSSVETIGRAAFKDCTNMSSVYMPAINLTEGEEFAGCKSLILLQIAGRSGESCSTIETSLPSESWNNTTSTKWMTWEMGASDWSNVDPSTDVEGKKQYRAGSLDLNQSDSVLKSGWLYYRQAVVKTDGATKCKIYDVPLTNPSGAYMHRVGFAEISGSGQITNYDAVVICYTLSTSQVTSYTLADSGSTSDLNAGVRNTRNVILPEPANGPSVTGKVAWGFGSTGQFDALRCALIHVPKNSYLNGEVFYGRDANVGLCMLNSDAVNNNRYYQNVRYLELEGLSKSADGMYYNASGYPLAKQPSLKYIEMLDGDEEKESSTQFFRDYTTPTVAFSEYGYLTQNWHMTRINTPILYSPCLKLGSNLVTAWANPLVYVGDNSDFNGYYLWDGTGGYQIKSDALVFNIEGIQVSHVSGIIYRDVYTGSVPGTYFEKGQLYLRDDINIVAQGAVNSFVNWFVIGNTLVIHSPYSDVEDNIAKGRQTIIPNYDPVASDPEQRTFAPWYDYLVNKTVKYIMVCEGIYQVGHYAFYTPEQNGIVNITLPSGLRTVGEYAFANAALAYLYVPNDVESFQSTSVSGCKSLEKIGSDGTGSYYEYGGCLYKKDPNTSRSMLVAVPNAKKEIVFDSVCDTIASHAGTGGSIRSLEVPAGITSIGSSAFEGSKIQSLTIDGSTALGESAFGECSDLVYVELKSNSEATISLGTKALTATSPNSGLSINLGSNIALQVTGTDPIPMGTYYKDGYQYVDVTADNIEEVLQPGHSYSRSSAALKDCSDDGSVKFYLSRSSENFVLNIIQVSSEGHFSDYTEGGTPWYSLGSSIETLNLDSSLSSLGTYSLSGLAITTCDIPTTVTQLKEGLFKGSSSLANVTFSSQISSIPDHCFDGCTALAKVNSPTAGSADLSGILSVGKEAFKGCSTITSADISDLADRTTRSITYGLGAGSFENTGLTSIEIPAGIAVIPDNAFKGTSLTQVIIPMNITAIGSDAFTDITSLDTVSFEGNSGAVAIENDSFDDRTESDHWYQNGVDDPKDNIYLFVAEGEVPRGNIFTIDAYWYNCGHEDDSDQVLFRYLAATKTIYITGQQEDAVLETYTDATGDQFLGKHTSQYASLAEAERVVITSVDILGAYMFYGNDAIFDISFSGTQIGASAFNGCGALKSFDLSQITDVGASAFEGSVMEGAIDLTSATAIGTNAFKDTEITSVDLNDATVSIGAAPFSCVGGTVSMKLEGTPVGELKGSEYTPIMNKNVLTYFLSQNTARSGEYGQMICDVTDLASTITPVTGKTLYMQGFLVENDLAPVLAASPAVTLGDDTADTKRYFSYASDSWSAGTASSYTAYTSGGAFIGLDGGVKKISGYKGDQTTVAFYMPKAVVASESSTHEYDGSKFIPTITEVKVNGYVIAATDNYVLDPSAGVGPDPGTYTLYLVSAVDDMLKFPMTLTITKNITVIFHDAGVSDIRRAITMPDVLTIPFGQAVQGGTFIGWYDMAQDDPDAEHAVLKCKAMTYFQPEDDLELYAWYVISQTINITTIGYLDGEVHSIDDKGTFTVPDSIASDKMGFITASPISGYSVRLVLQNAYLEASGDDVYRFTPLGTDSDGDGQMDGITVSIYVSTILDGIGDFRIAAFTNGNQGALVILEAASSGGLIDGSVSVKGVYYATFGEGTTAVRAFGAIDMDYEGESFAGKERLSWNPVLANGEIYNIYAQYTYELGGEDNTVTTPMLSGNNVTIITT